MIAKEKFTVGQRVRMTDKALKQGLGGLHATRKIGIVRGFPMREIEAVRDKTVRILCDGKKAAGTYHMDFWEPDE